VERVWPRASARSLPLAQKQLVREHSLYSLMGKKEGFMLEKWVFPRASGKKGYHSLTRWNVRLNDSE